MSRRSYEINIRVNGIRIRQLVIDAHYELKHSESISDLTIIELVHQLDGGDFTPETETTHFEYFMTENLFLKSKRYRLVWLIEKESLYLGVINAYRRKK